MFECTVPVFGSLKTAGVVGSYPAPRDNLYPGFPFTIRVAKGEDPAKRFLLRSAAFEAGDWKRIESAKGQLRPGMRATVWECRTGGVSVLTIDWEPPAPRKNRG